MKKTARPRREVKFTFQPLVSWLILALTITTFFPRRLEIAGYTLLAVAILALLYSYRRTATLLTLLPYLVTVIAAIFLPLPLPPDWYPVSRLLVTLLVWTAVLGLLVILTSRWLPHLPESSPSIKPHTETY